MDGGFISRFLRPQMSGYEKVIKDRSNIFIVAQYREWCASNAQIHLGYGRIYQQPEHFHRLSSV